MEPENQYRIYNSPKLDPRMSQLNPVYTLAVSSKSILAFPSYLRPSLSSGFNLLIPTKIKHAFLTCPIRATCPAHPIFPVFITIIISCEACKLWSS